MAGAVEAPSYQKAARRRPLLVFRNAGRGGWHRWCRQGDLDVAQDEVVPDLRPSAARDDRLGRCSSGVYDARSEYEIIVAISEDRGVQAGFPRPVLSAGCL